jgi:hypothetical protein
MPVSECFAPIFILLFSLSSRAAGQTRLYKNPRAGLELFGAHGTVEKFDHVHHFLFALDALDARAELQ